MGHKKSTYLGGKKMKFTKLEEFDGKGYGQLNI